MENQAVHKLIVIFKIVALSSTVYGQAPFVKSPAPDGHRCGVCPTYFQKICAFDFDTNSTYIFDNHCVMDLYNCIHGTGRFEPLPIGRNVLRNLDDNTIIWYHGAGLMMRLEGDHRNFDSCGPIELKFEFINQHYENCLFFGNFAYVHGYKYEDFDYGEDHIIVKDTKKNPDSVK